LMDCAVELAEHFRHLLRHRLDVETAIANLMHRPPYARNTVDVRECLRMIGELRRHEAMRKHIYDMEHSTCWRITAPLRAAKDMLTSWRLR